MWPLFLSGDARERKGKWEIAKADADHSRPRAFDAGAKNS
jgi:hypothetical protein